VIKTNRFLISKRPYAVDLSSLATEGHSAGDNPYWTCTVKAVWFRRRRGETVACLGHLWDIQHTKPATAVEMLERHDDGRYGGTTLCRWNGRTFWGAVTLEAMERHLAVLRPMLAAYPALPDGFDGWWTFAAPTPSGGTAPKENP
jgi:hypothetical protein